MNLKTITGAAILALAATCYMAPASALPVMCKVDTNNHMNVDSQYVVSCLDAGSGNGNLGFMPGHSTIEDPGEETNRNVWK